MPARSARQGSEPNQGVGAGANEVLEAAAKHGDPDARLFPGPGPDRISSGLCWPSVRDKDAMGGGRRWLARGARCSGSRALGFAGEVPGLARWRRALRARQKALRPELSASVASFRPRLGGFDGVYS